MQATILFLHCSIQPQIPPLNLKKSGSGNTQGMAQLYICMGPTPTSLRRPFALYVVQPRLPDYQTIWLPLLHFHCSLFGHNMVDIHHHSQRCRRRI